MRSSKSRSRSKSNRNRPNSGGNVVNRVFDSSGPEGKVRGTPQQIIEKYNQLARDAQLSNDRVATENFQQHAEHYLRLLSSAQREIDQRREEQERQNRERQAERDRDRDRNDRQDNAPARAQESSDPGASPQPDVIDLASEDTSDSNLVTTPESAEKPAEMTEKAEKPARKPRARKPAAPKAPKEPGEKPSRAKAVKPSQEHTGESSDESGPAEAAE